MRIRALLVMGVVQMLSTVAFSQPYSSESLDSIIKSSGAKPVLVEFGATWCAACRELEKNVLEDAAVKHALRTITYVRYDVDDKAGADAASAYNVTEYPTLIAVNVDGSERFRRTYAQLTEGDRQKNFVGLIRETHAIVETESEFRGVLRTDAVEGTDSDLAIARWHEVRGEHDAATKRLRALLKVRRLAPTQRAVATRMLNDIMRKTGWRKQVSTDALAVLRSDFEHPSLDELIIASVSSALPPDQIASLYAKLARSITDNALLLDIAYVAIAAGESKKALEIATQLVAAERTARTLALLAAARLSEGRYEEALESQDSAILEAKGASSERALKSDRVLIASHLEPARVTDIRFMASDLWRRLDGVTALRDTDSSRADTLRLVRAIRRVSYAVGQKCKTYAGTTDSVFARLHIDGAAGTIDAVELFSMDGTTEPLKDCLMREFRRSTLPATATSISTQMTPVTFN